MKSCNLHNMYHKRIGIINIFFEVGKGYKSSAPLPVATALVSAVRFALADNSGINRSE